MAPAPPAPVVQLDLPALLLLVTRAVTEDVHDRLARAGYPDVRPTDGYTFQLLASTGGATGVQVAEHLGITKQAAGKLLEQLEDRGYVARTAAVDDGRARPARLTERGWACIRTATALWRDVEEQAAAALGAEPLATARRVLEALAAERGAFAAPLRLRPPR
jgi:DNA-binding MarR family transcriptional regulator